MDAGTQARLTGSELERRLSASAGQPVLQQREGRYFALKTAQEACVFLDNNHLCSIHQELGAAFKPRGCRQFPFRLVRTPDGIYAGVSFYCPAVQANQGRPLASHQAELLELAADLPEIRTVSVVAGVVLDWTLYRRLDDWLQAELEGQDPESTLARALWALGQVVKTRQPRRLESFLESSGPALEPPHEPFVLVHEHFTATLLARCEVEQKRREAFRADWLAQRPVTLARFGGWRGRRRDLRDHVSEEPLRRYLKATIFRKYLATRRPLLHNLALLYLVPGLYRLWTQLADHERALEECESKLVTHPNDLDTLSGEMALGFLEQVDR